MPKNASKTGKSSKTARVLSLLTDPAASLLGGSRNHKDDETEALDERKPQGLDDAATESRIQASLAAEEDSLVTELFGKKEAPSRARRTDAPPENAAPAPQGNAPSASAPDAQEPDPRTLELLSMLSNPSTLGNSAMPSYTEEAPLRPAALEKDFADELTAGMAEQPAPPQEEEDADAAWAAQAAPQYAQPMRQAPPQSAQQPPQQQAPQPMRQPAQQPAPQPVQQPPQPMRQPAQQPAPQPVQQPPQPVRQPAQQPAPQPAQRTAPQPVQPAPQPVQQAPRPATAHDNENFVCFNLTQALVEDKADKLMKQFGMCTCNRCKVDVTAIALSNLPAKYVAMQNRDILPLLSMYEEKYSAAVTVQVMNACRMVMKRPHHGR